jgi:hypothetical protein
MAPEISTKGQRAAQYVFTDHVERKLEEIALSDARGGSGSGD